MCLLSVTDSVVVVYTVGLDSQAMHVQTNSTLSAVVYISCRKPPIFCRYSLVRLGRMHSALHRGLATRKLSVCQTRDL